MIILIILGILFLWFLVWLVGTFIGVIRGASKKSADGTTFKERLAAYKAEQAAIKRAKQLKKREKRA